ncbi:MAG TPA: hypothetical protein VHL78_11480 [Actinomycetota bacterium]|nr:hypothetical protein [Actinomycetota bacterium]
MESVTRDSSRAIRTSAEGTLYVFLGIVLLHWAEHVVQAVQIYVLDWPKTEALGLLGLAVPGLVRSEWLHWGYNLAVFAGLWLLMPGFERPAGRWWKAALLVQGWHFTEHGLLLFQAVTAVHLLGVDVPTSVLQLVVPRVELHLFYNGIVTALLLVGAVMRLRGERGRRSSWWRRPVRAAEPTRS